MLQNQKYEIKKKKTEKQDQVLFDNIDTKIFFIGKL